MKEKQKTPKENTREGWMTTAKERMDYGLYLAGQNIIYTLITARIATYLPMTGISPAASAPVILLVKLWDAINDALFGGIFDKVKFKKQEKFLPWLRISIVFIPLATVMMFAIPRSFGMTGKLIWFAIAYVFWDMSYTLCDVPIYGMVTTMTNNLRERTSIMSYSKLYVGAAIAITVGLGDVLISREVGMSFTSMAIVFSAIALATMLPICLRGRERNYQGHEKEQEFSFKQMFKYLLSNKYLLVYYLSFIVAEGLATSASLGIFVSYYLFGNELFNTVLMVLSTVPVVVVTLFMPKIMAKIDKFKILYWCKIAAIALGLLIYFVGYGNIVVFIILSVLRSVPVTVAGFLMFMFTPDCAEYGQYKTGTEARGITFAIQTFSAKLAASTSTALGVFALGLFGWKAVDAGSFAELQTLTEQGFRQTPQALNGLWFTYTIIPVIGIILSVIVLRFYRLNDKSVQVMARCNSGEISFDEAELALGEINKRPL